jgi:hypothetical protein
MLKSIGYCGCGSRVTPGSHCSAPEYARTKTGVDKRPLLFGEDVPVNTQAALSDVMLLNLVITTVSDEMCYTD